SAGSDTKIKVTEPANDGNQGKSSKDRKGSSRDRSKTQKIDDDEGEIIYEEYEPE
ncbi:unnamed protein product, partial [Rotaria magnacalcarata]